MSDIETKRAKVLLALLAVAALAMLSGRAEAGNGQWTTGGPEGGLVREIVPSPNLAQDGTVFSAAQNRGVLKSTDRGTTWTVSGNGMNNADVRSIAVSPAYASDHTVFAGSLGGGVFKSTNGGQSWVAVNSGLPTLLVWTVALSPQFASDRTVFAATDDRGVYRSSNGGESWIQANTGLTLTSFLAIAVSPNYASDRLVLAGAQGGLFKSTDGGNTWRWAGNGITGPDIRQIVFSPNFANDGVAFVATEMHGVFKSVNRGDSWFDPSGGRGPVDIGRIAISPNFANDNTLFASNPTYGYSKTGDGGATWASHIPFVSWFPYSTNTDGLSIAVSPNYPADPTLWGGTIGTGIFRTQNNGASWELVRTGYYAARSDRVAASPTYADDHAVFVTTLGSGLFGSSDGGQSWRPLNASLDQHIHFGLVSAIAVSPAYASDRTLFVTRADPYVLVRTRDGGRTWEPASAGLPAAIINNVALSPAFPADGTMFAVSAGRGVYRSTNRGDNWSAINTGLTNLQTTAVAVSPHFATDRTVFVSTDGGGVFKSTNAGASWTAINSGLPSLVVRNVLVSPAFASDRTVFAHTYEGIARSTDGGATWTLVAPGYAYRVVALSPNFGQDNTMYAGVSWGVLRSTNRGQTWTDISAGMGHTFVVDLAVGGDGDGHTVFAATRGGGVYQFSSGNVPPVPTTTATATQGPPTATATRTATPATPWPTATPTRTPTPVPPGGPYRVNAGGPQYTAVDGRVWQADRAYTAGSFGYVDGRTYSTSDPIAGTDDDALYQTERWGMSAYRFDVPNGTYRVELLFAEIYDFQAGKRVFDVKIQGVTVLANFCPFAAAGGRNIALRYVFQTSVTNRQLLIEFVPRVGAAKINALLVARTGPLASHTPTATGQATMTPTPTGTAIVGTPSVTATATPPATTTPTTTPTTAPSTATATATTTPVPPVASYRVNAGGPQYAAVDGRVWQADRAYTAGSFGYVDGRTYSTSDPIAGTDDDALYQTERWGMSAYRFDVPNGTYRVELLFAEIYDFQAGKRVFDVKIQGVTVLANFCPFAAAGGRNIALRHVFPATVSDGRLLVEFMARVGAAKISAIAVEPAGPAVTPTATASATMTGRPSRTATPSPTATATPPGLATQTPTATATPTTGRPVDIAVNCGGPAYHGADGTLWQADQGYSGGSWGYLDGKTFATNYPIDGTQDDTLYQTERWGLTGYRFDLPPGTYQVELRFAEIYAWQGGQRVFDVSLEGAVVLPMLDIFDAAGRFTAYDRMFVVQVTDGALDIGFVPRLNSTKINAIRVRSAP